MKTVQELERKPRLQVRTGRFSLTLWDRKMLLSNGHKDSIGYIEVVTTVRRACLQYSVKNRLTGKFENQQIWFPADDIRTLAALIDKLNDVDVEGDSSPSMSSSMSRGDE